MNVTDRSATALSQALPPGGNVTGFTIFEHSFARQMVGDAQGGRTT